MAAWRTDEATFGFGDGSELLDGAAISRDVFEVLGVKPILGRPFTAEEDQLGGVDAVILSYGMWHERYGDPSVVGRRVMVDGGSLEIVGVMDRDFVLPEEARYGDRCRMMRFSSESGCRRIPGRLRSCK